MAFMRALFEKVDRYKIEKATRRIREINDTTFFAGDRYKRSYDILSRAPEFMERLEEYSRGKMTRQEFAIRIDGMAKTVFALEGFHDSQKRRDMKSLKLAYAGQEDKIKILENYDKFQDAIYPLIKRLKRAVHHMKQSFEKNDLKRLKAYVKVYVRCMEDILHTRNKYL